MSEKLQKSPLGWLEFMTLKALGRAPETISSEVRPVVDATEFYGLDRVFWGQQTATAQTLSATYTFNFAPAVAPRRLLALSGTLTFGANAGTALNMALLLVSPDGVSATHIGSRWIIAPVATLLYPIHAELTKPLVLPPGSTMRLQISSDATGNDHAVTIRGMWHRLDPIS